MHLTWALLHLDQTPVKFEGVPITFTDRRPGGKVEVGINGARRASLPLALDVPYRGLVTPVNTLLRATLHGDGWEEIIFHGKVTPEKKGSAEGTELLVNAVDPLAQLNSMLARVGSEGPLPGNEFWDALVLGGKGAPLTKSSDQSDILWGAIASVSGHGIKKGTLTSLALSAKKTFQPGESIGEAITQFCESAVALDFEFAPIVASDGTWVELNTYAPKQGTDKSATVKFVYGAAPESAVDFSHAPSGEIINRVVVGGQGSSGSTRHCTVWEHLESIEKYGVYELFVADTPSLGDLVSANGIVYARAFPLDFFSFSPALELPDGGDPGFGVPPIFGPGEDADYWVGDTIALEAHEPGATEPLNLKGRVTDATLTETASGQLSVSLDCTPENKATGVTFRNIHMRIPEDEEVGE